MFRKSLIFTGFLGLAFGVTSGVAQDEITDERSCATVVGGRLVEERGQAICFVEWAQIAQTRHVVVRSPIRLHVEREFTSRGIVEVYGGLQLEGESTIGGQIQIRRGGSFINRSAMTVQDAGVFNEGDTRNLAGITLEGGGVLENSGSFSNGPQGTVHIRGDGAVLRNRSEFDNLGVIHNERTLANLERALFHNENRIFNRGDVAVINNFAVFRSLDDSIVMNELGAKFNNLQGASYVLYEGGEFSAAGGELTNNNIIRNDGKLTFVRTGRLINNADLSMYCESVLEAQPTAITNTGTISHFFRVTMPANLPGVNSIPVQCPNLKAPR